MNELMDASFVFIGPDGMRLGPLSIGWIDMSLFIGMVTWFALSRMEGSRRTALAVVVTARLAAILPGWDMGRSVLSNMQELFDLRRGEWAFIPAIVAGLIVILWFASDGLKRALFAYTTAIVLGALPLLLKAAPQPERFPQLAFLPLGQQAATWQGPAIVNVWATWCGPCRSEMPLLLREAESSNIVLLNVGETASTVEQFMLRYADSKKNHIWLGGDMVKNDLRVIGLPTTFVLDASGQIIHRHMGPLSRAQLLDFRRMMYQSTQSVFK